MRLPLRQTDDLLRGALPADEPPGRALPRLVLTLVVCGAFYGVVMGCWGGRWLQAVYSGSKVPLLLLATFALSVPSFFVLNTLLGLRADWPRVLRALVAAQAGLTVILASLAPLTGFWYASVHSYDAALLFNAAMFGTASVAAQALLRRAYRPLIARDARHRTMLRAWLVIYAFVGVQAGWVLRPFVGSPGVETKFLRAKAWGNAYVEVAHTVGRALGL
ncbi:MAG TPA: hypothetical protein VF796_26990 [Humisphaera sp.]